MRYSSAADIHVDILELFSSGAPLSGEIQATLEAHLMETRSSFPFHSRPASVQLIPQQKTVHEPHARPEGDLTRQNGRAGG